MTLDFVSEYIHNYGYFVVFAVLFIAMIGIPAPEETFMLLIGGMLLDSGLTFFQVIVIALLGTNSAMLVTYLAGRKLGNRLVSRYGHKFHITPAKWEKMKQDLEKYDGIATVCTYFLPGVRQVVPYLSGTRKVPYPVFLLFTFTGSLLWSVFYTAVGYYLGNALGPVFLASFVLAVSLLFAGVCISKWITKNRAEQKAIAHK
ncbi:DedA family protein [Pradoshia sp.]